ncbi:MFS transporter [Celeribacter sp. ULVN23_4]
MSSTNTSLVASCWGARLSFLAAGLSIGGWAPLIPSIKQSLGIGEAAFGSVLLFLGLGSLFAMPPAGIIASKFGAQRILPIVGLMTAVLLPLLALAPSVLLLGATLMIFGAFLGALDVAINVHGSAVEQKARRPLMSGFHALFSVGNLVGAMLATALLGAGLSPVAVATICAVIEALALLIARPMLLSNAGGSAEKLAFPRGVVVVFAALLAVTFLIEGAFLDWSGLLAIELGQASVTTAGWGFSTFAAAMVVMRFSGDFLTARLGTFFMLTFGTVFGAGGIVLALSSGSFGLTLFGFGLSGNGLTNMSPILISAAGRYAPGSAAVAVASATTAGYAGHLMGPALVGFVAEASSLSFAFSLLAGMLSVTPLIYFIAIKTAGGRKVSPQSRT